MPGRAETTLEGSLRRFFAERLKEVWSGIPAQVEAVHDDYTIDCTPSIDILRAGTFQKLAPRILRRVPLAELGGGGWRIKIPVRVGQQVLLHVMNRGLDAWKQTHAKGAMPDEGLWSIKDALAYPIAIGTDWETEPEANIEITNEAGDKKILLSPTDARMETSPTRKVSVSSDEVELEYDGNTVSIDSDSVDVAVGTARATVSEGRVQATTGRAGLDVTDRQSRINFGSDIYIQADVGGLRLVAGSTQLRLRNNGNMEYYRRRATGFGSRLWTPGGGSTTWDIQSANISQPPA